MIALSAMSYASRLIHACGGEADVIWTDRSLIKICILCRFGLASAKKLLRGGKFQIQRFPSVIYGELMLRECVSSAR